MDSPLEISIPANYLNGFISERTDRWTPILYYCTSRLFRKFKNFYKYSRWEIFICGLDMRTFRQSIKIIIYPVLSEYIILNTKNVYSQKRSKYNFILVGTPSCDLCDLLCVSAGRLFRWIELVHSCSKPDVTLTRMLHREEEDDDSGLARCSRYYSLTWKGVGVKSNL